MVLMVFSPQMICLVLSFYQLSLITYVKINLATSDTSKAEM